GLWVSAVVEVQQGVLQPKQRLRPGADQRRCSVYSGPQHEPLLVGGDRDVRQGTVRTSGGERGRVLHSSLSRGRRSVRGGRRGNVSQRRLPIRSRARWYVVFADSSQPVPNRHVQRRGLPGLERARPNDV